MRSYLSFYYKKNGDHQQCLVIVRIPSHNTRGIREKVDSMSMLTYLGCYVWRRYNMA